MTTTTSTTGPSHRTYGGWSRPSSPGIGGLKLIPTAMLLAGLVFTLLVAMLGGLALAVLTAAVLAVAAAPAAVSWHGRPVYAALTRRVAWKRAVTAGRHMYRSGAGGVSPDGSRRLPGLLAPVRLWAAGDAQGRPFALVEMPQARQWAVVIRTAAQAGALVDPGTRDVWVASWGEWLAHLGAESGVVQAAVVVETAPDAGALLAAHVAGMIRPDTPEFARAVLADAAVELPTGVAETTAYVTVTFSERGLGVQRGREPEAAAAAAAEEIGRRLPGLTVPLQEAGASAGEPLTGEELSRRVRQAFDPLVGAEFAEAEAAGEPVQVRWEDAGPAAAEEAWDCYRHDSGWSRTYEALLAPPGVVRDSVMERLLSPIPGAPRKRVTLFYRPVDAAETAAVVDREVKAAINRQFRRKGLAHAHDTAALRSARQAAEEEADGAGVASVGLYVTVTADDFDALTTAATAVERAARGSRWRLSPVYGAQAAAFAGALGIGVSLPDLSLLPAPARAHL